MMRTRRILKPIYLLSLAKDLTSFHTTVSFDNHNEKKTSKESQTGNVNVWGRENKHRSRPK